MRPLVRAVALVALLAQTGAAQVAVTGGVAPGAREILALSFANAQPGQVPPGLRLVTGNVDITAKDGARMLRAASAAEFLITLLEPLPTDFTIEFDLIPKECGCGEKDLEFDGTSGAWSGASARVQWSPADQQVSGGGPSPFTMTTPALGETAPGQLTRIIASFEGNTLKLYTNGQRLYTLSDRVFARGRVLRVILGGQDEEQAVYLTRLRVAAGAATTTTVAAAPVTALPATQSGTMTPMAPPPPPTLPTSQLPGTTATPSSDGNPTTATRAGMLVGPAPTGLTATGTPGTATLSWIAVSGATGYTVNRAPAGTTSWVALTTGQITVTKLANDLLPNVRGTYTYEVVAHQPDGRVGSAKVDFTPPAPADPTELVAELVPPAGIRLSWKAAKDATEYVVSGPGFPPDARTSTTSISVMAVPPGLNAYRVASVFPPGKVLTAVSAWPSAIVKVPPVPSVAFLSLPNGSGSPDEYKRHKCETGQWVAAELGSSNEWCNQYPDLFQLLRLFAIEVRSWDEPAFRPPAPPNGRAGFEWGQNGAAIPEAAFVDHLLDADRKVGCVTRGAGAAAATMCFAESYQRSTHHKSLSVIVQTADNTRFLSFGMPGSYAPEGTVDLWGWGSPPLISGDRNGPCSGLWCSWSNIPDNRSIPHVCLACHGGRYDAATGRVTGATLLPLDPRDLGFLWTTPRAPQEETIRHINGIVYASPGVAPAVRSYIQLMYRGKQAIIGAAVDDSYVPAGWSEQRAIYERIYRPYCASCHVAQPGPLGFSSWADMVIERERIKRSVCAGTMPHAWILFSDFWAQGGSVSLPGLLLAALGYQGC